MVRCSAPNKLDHRKLEFSAVISLAGRSGNDEGIKVHGRPEGVHSEAGGRWSPGGRDLPQGRDNGGDVLQLKEEV